MKFSIIFTTVLVASASAVPNAKHMEVDKLADKGMAKLRAYIAKNGYPNPEKCTLENAAVRKEWLVKPARSIHHIVAFTNICQVISFQG
jgi:tyrosinase